VIGYGLSALTKPVFPLATSIGWVFGARFTDRIGKGIRGAPRDALVADIVPPRQRGAAYGLRQALDSVGAFLGPLLALIFMAWFSNDIKAVLWVAVVPALLAVLVLVAGVSEPPSGEIPGRDRSPLTFRSVLNLPGRYWLVVLLGAVFTLARFSEAFLLLRAQDLGLTLGYIPAILIVMNVVFSSAAYPAGRAADHLSPRTLFLTGLGVLIIADGVLAAATIPWMVFPGAALWGLHMALTQGLLSKLVSDSAPAGLRGTAFGIFHLVSGVALLLASAIAGALWTLLGPQATFLAGAGFALLAAAGLILIRPRGA
jgi:MFS family permease